MSGLQDLMEHGALLAIQVRCVLARKSLLSKCAQACRFAQAPHTDAASAVVAAHGHRCSYTGVVVRACRHCRHCCSFFCHAFLILGPPRNTQRRACTDVVLSM